MARVLDPANHMGAAILAGVALDRRFGIDNRQLVTIRDHQDFVARHHGHDGKHRTVRLPALGATTGVVVKALAIDLDRNRIGGAFAVQRAALEIGGSRLQAAIN